MCNPLLYSELGFSVSNTLLWCFTRQCIWEGCVGVELWNTLCFGGSKECVAAGKAKTRPSLPLLLSSHIQEAWVGSSTVWSLQVQFSPCIKTVLGRHFYKFWQISKVDQILVLGNLESASPLRRNIFQGFGVGGFFYSFPIRRSFSYSSFPAKFLQVL